MKARVTKISQQKYSRTENVYWRINLRLETGEFAMTDVVPTYKNFAFWEPVIKAGVGTTIGGVFLKEGGWKPLKVNADSQVFIIQEPLIKESISDIEEEVFRVRVGNPEIWAVTGSKGKRYEVTILNGFVTCEYEDRTQRKTVLCEGYRFSGKRNTCKHIQKVEAKQSELRKVEQAKIPTLF